MGESLAVGHFDADQKARVHHIPQQEGFNASQGIFRLLDDVDRAGNRQGTAGSPLGRSQREAQSEAFNGDSYHS